MRSALALLLFVPACSRDTGAAPKPPTPYAIEQTGCVSPYGRDAGLVASVHVANSIGPGQATCVYELSDRATVKVSLETKPPGGTITVDGAPTSTVELALAPLLFDETWADLHAWYPKDEARLRVRERLAERSTRKVEVRGNGRTDTFTLKIVEIELTDAAWVTLVREAAKLPKKAASQGPKGVFVLGKSGVFLAGRKPTLGDFDWLAVEEETDRLPARECTYTSGQIISVVPAGSKVVVTTREGAPVAEKAFPADKNAPCSDRIFTINGLGPDRTRVAHRTADAIKWLNGLAGVDKK